MGVRVQREIIKSICGEDFGMIIMILHVEGSANSSIWKSEADAYTESTSTNYQAVTSGSASRVSYAGSTSYDGQWLQWNFYQTNSSLGDSSRIGS